MGQLSDAIAQVVEAVSPDVVVCSVQAMRFLRGELEEIGKWGPHVSVLGKPVVSNPSLPANSVYFFKDGQCCSRIENIRRKLWTYTTKPLGNTSPRT